MLSSLYCHCSGDRTIVTKAATNDFRATNPLLDRDCLRFAHAYSGAVSHTKGAAVTGVAGHGCCVSNVQPSTSTSDIVPTVMHGCVIYGLYQRHRRCSDWMNCR